MPTEIIVVIITAISTLAVIITSAFLSRRKEVQVINLLEIIEKRKLYIKTCMRSIHLVIGY